MQRVVAIWFFFFFQAEDGIRDWSVTGVQTCALPIWGGGARAVDERSAPAGAAGDRAAVRGTRARQRDRQIGRASCRERV